MMSTESRRETSVIGCKNCLPANAGYVKGVRGWVPCVCNPNPVQKVCDSCSLCVKRRSQPQK